MKKKFLCAGIILLLTNSFIMGQQSTNEGATRNFNFEFPLLSQSDFDSQLFASANAGKPGDSCSRRYSILHARSSVESGVLQTEVRMNRADWVCAIFKTRIGNDSGYIRQSHQPVLTEEGTIEFIPSEPTITGFSWASDLVSFIGEFTKSYFSLQNLVGSLLSGDDLGEFIGDFFAVDDISNVINIVNTLQTELPELELSNLPELAPQEFVQEVLKNCKGTVGENLSVLIEDGIIKVSGECKLQEDI